MEKTVEKFYELLMEMQNGGRSYWRELAKILDREVQECEEAAEWLRQISEGDEI